MFSYLFPRIFPLSDPVLIFSIVLILFLFAPIIMGRFKLPGMIGLLIAGAILGPHSLGILDRDASFILLGAVGLIYIMFTAALEVDLSVFRKYGFQGLVFGLITFILPQFFGSVVAYYILGFNWLAAILLGSLLASHTLLAYPIVSRLGLSANKAVTTTIGGTMITDTLALLVLAVISAMSSGEVSEAMWWRLGFSFITYTCTILFGLKKLGSWFFEKFPNDATAQFVFVLSSVFLSASLSHVAGLEPIIGAFLAGIALNKLIPHNSTLMNRINFTGEAIFIPFFLLSVGMLLDVKVLFTSFRSWYIAIGMCISVVGAKWIASEISRIIFRFNQEETKVMFGLSVVQAAATLAAVMVGHRLELFDDAVINATIIMILVTCILGPYIVNKFAPTLALQQAKEEENAPILKNEGILIPLHHLEEVLPCVELALLLKNQKAESRMFPTYIVSDKQEADMEHEKVRAEKILNQAVTLINASGQNAKKILRVDQFPGAALIKIRKELGIHHVLMHWDFKPAVSDAKIGLNIDEIVKDFGSNLILSYLPQSLNITNRIIVFFPQTELIEDEFHSFSKTLIHLSKQIGSPLFIICHDQIKNELIDLFQNIDRSLKISFSSFTSERMWLAILVDNITSHDLLVQYGSRKIFSDHSDDKYFINIIRKIMSKFSENNFLLIYGQDDAISPPPVPSEPT